MVLGVQWLRDLGDILFNFKKLTMLFEHQGKLLPLKGVVLNMEMVDTVMVNHAMLNCERVKRRRMGRTKEKNQ